MFNDIKEIPDELKQRDRCQDALIFISEQNIPTSWKVGLLIGYGKAINKTFSYADIEFALKDHETTDVGKE